MKFILLFLITLSQIISCLSSSQRDKQLQLKIKTLEFSRSANVERWREVSSTIRDHDMQVFFADALAKVKRAELLPVMQEILKTCRHDSVTAKLIFAIGQLSTSDAEKFLLSLPFDSLNYFSKRNVVSALGFCASERTVSFLKSHHQTLRQMPEFYITSSLCARKKVDVRDLKNLIFSDSTNFSFLEERAYFLANSASFQDLKHLVDYGRKTAGLTQKYYLKRIGLLLNQNKNEFLKIASTDSLFYNELINWLSILLSSAENWTNKYHAIKICSVICESSLIWSVSGYLNSPFPQLSVAAHEAVGNTNPDLASSLLPALIQSENNMFVKGQLIKILAVQRPQLAYHYIMNTLDKGDPFFKESLLEALNLLDTPGAQSIIRQFLSLPDNRLANSAFELLKTKRLLSSEDVDIFLNRNNHSSKTMAIEYLIENNSTLSFQQLFNFFTNYKQPSQIELQTSIINALKKTMYPLNSDEKILLWKNSAHHLIQNKLRSEFLIPDQPPFSCHPALAFLPEALQPDSIQYAFTTNPVIQILTTKGGIVAELLPNAAPLTTQHFLNLINIKFYRNLYFHRVVADFVIQGGDPQADGWGGTEYLIPSEHNSHPFKRGSIGIATSGFDTGSSQFFICQSAQPHLTGNYTLFGQVISGMDIVDAILPGDKILEIIRLRQL